MAWEELRSLHRVDAVIRTARDDIGDNVLVQVEEGHLVAENLEVGKQLRQVTRAILKLNLQRHDLQHD